MRIHFRLAAVLLAVLSPALTQAQPADNGFDELNWTGPVQDPAAARKEANAALAEGRRECARQASASRAACMKQVEDDHRAAVQRIKGPPPAAAAAGKRKP